jgi:hypothetical protein
MTYRIVNTDNFGSDYPNEFFTEDEPYILEELAQLRADELNAGDNDYSPRYYKVVEMPYELAPGFEP